MSDYLKIARQVLHDRQTPPEPESLEAVLKGRAIELWSDAAGGRLWLVADEADAKQLGEPRGTVFTASEARRVIEIADPEVVAEIALWKRNHNTKITEVHLVRPDAPEVGRAKSRHSDDSYQREDLCP